MNRRNFLKSTFAVAAAASLPRVAGAQGRAKSAHAEAMIFIWLPGGIAQQDAWDPKPHTPFTRGMKGSDLLATCPRIPTAADGIFFAAGFEQIASVMDKGAVLRSLTNDTPFGAVHLKAQQHMLTGCPFPAGMAAPSMGSVVARALGRRDPRTPPYIDVGRDAGECDPVEARFLDECRGPGFLGPRYAPHLMTEMDWALLARENEAKTIAACDTGDRFGLGCLAARRFVERGARFVHVECPYQPYAGFDAHEHGAARTAEMKRRIDRPIAQLVRDLDARGLLDRTLVVVASEFGRTVASPFAADPDTGEHLVIQNEIMYGFHAHFSRANAVLFFGGGFKRGFTYGRTAERHPMIAIENPVSMSDVHATIYKSLGIPPDGGKAIEALLV